MLDRPHVCAHLPRIGDSRLLALVAPAGYGKTTLLRQWLATQPVAAHWINGPDGLDALDAFVPPPIGRAAVVLDDLDATDATVAAAALERALAALPARVTIVVAARRPLPLRTARLRATGAMTLLTRDELAITVDELRALTSDRRAREIHAWTAGWPEPALRLATQEADAAMVPLDDELLDRVLDDVPLETRKVLVIAARCRGLTVDLATTVLGDTSAARALDDLVDRHALLTRNGDEFTIAPVLAAALRRRHRSTQRCHRAVGRWYRDHARPADALEHAAAARDRSTVAAVFDDAVEQVMASDDVPRLARWTADVPPPASAPAVARQRAGLASAVLRRADRGAWAPSACDAGSAIGDAVRAVDLLRSGSLRECADAVAESSAGLDTVHESVRPTVAAMLAVLEFDVELLTTWSVDDEVSRQRLRIADDARWPWLLRWAFGQRALYAVLRGDVDAARALLARAEARGAAAPGGGVVDQGGYGIAAALVAGSTATNADERRHAIRTLTEIVERADGYGTAAGVVARYALHRIHADAGERAPAMRHLQEADHLREEFADLRYLTAVRARLTDLLSPRERLVVDQLRTDRTVREIAAELVLSPHTVRSQIRSIYRKLGVSSRGQVVAIADGLARQRSTAP